MKENKKIARTQRGDCLSCRPLNFFACTRYELMQKMDVAELADYLESELGDGVPSDCLAWLMEPSRQVDTTRP